MNHASQPPPLTTTITVHHHHTLIHTGPHTHARTKHTHHYTRTTLYAPPATQGACSPWTHQHSHCNSFSLPFRLRTLSPLPVSPLPSPTSPSTTHCPGFDSFRCFSPYATRRAASQRHDIHFGFPSRVKAPLERSTHPKLWLSQIES